MPRIPHLGLFTFRKSLTANDQPENTYRFLIPSEQVLNIAPVSLCIQGGEPVPGSDAPGAVRVSMGGIDG